MSRCRFPRGSQEQPNEDEPPPDDDGAEPWLNHWDIPKESMYGIFTYIWVIYGVNVGKYSIHGSYGIPKSSQLNPQLNDAD